MSSASECALSEPCSVARRNDGRTNLSDRGRVLWVQPRTDGRAGRPRWPRTPLLKRAIVAWGCVALTCVGSPANAGVDVAGTISAAQVAGDGTLWFLISDSRTATYCAPGWFGFNLKVPRTHADYPYYYGVVMMALTKQKPVYLANISVYNGSTACDITATGYGIVLMN